MYVEQLQVGTVGKVYASDVVVPQSEIGCHVAESRHVDGRYVAVDCDFFACGGSVDAGSSDLHVAGFIFSLSVVFSTCSGTPVYEYRAVVVGCVYKECEVLAFFHVECDGRQFVGEVDLYRGIFGDDEPSGENLFTVDRYAAEAFSLFGVWVYVYRYAFERRVGHAFYRLEIFGLPLADDEFSTLRHVEVVVEAVSEIRIQAVKRPGLVFASVGGTVHRYQERGIDGGVVAGYVAYPLHVRACGIGGVGMLGIGAFEPQVGGIRFSGDGKGHQCICH